MIFTELNFRRLFAGNFIRVIGGGVLNIAPAARLRKCKIYVHPGAELIIGNNVLVEYADIFVEKGMLKLDDFAIIKGSKSEKTAIIINNGNVVVSDHAKLSLRRMWVRFGGVLNVGSYTNINSASEIRCDESVAIGSYNQISYNVRIWDTNTHSILPKMERRQVTETRYPYFGYESSRPATSPVKIGDDCWIGENCAILKGSEIGNECILGYDTLITGKTIPAKSRVVNERHLRITTC